MIMYMKYIMCYVMFWAKPYSKHVFFFCFFFSLSFLEYFGLKLLK
jgi:hypothetical protein